MGRDIGKIAAKRVGDEARVDTERVEARDLFGDPNVTAIVAEKRRGSNGENARTGERRSLASVFSQRTACPSLVGHPRSLIVQVGA